MSAPFAAAAAPAPLRAVPTLPIGSGEVREARLVLSPNSLGGLLRFIRAARDTLESEQMSHPSTWRDPDNEKFLSPIVVELIEAARRGVAVRVIVNDDKAFGGSPTGKMGPNEITARLLNSIAQCDDLPLEARVINVKATGITYVHNKGYLADGRKVLVSSINGTKNSIMNNREVAVHLDSVDAHQYFLGAFQFDWTRSPALDSRKIPADQTPPGVTPVQGCLELSRSAAKIFFPGSQPGSFAGLY